MLSLRLVSIWENEIIFTNINHACIPSRIILSLFKTEETRIETWFDCYDKKFIYIY